jgi:hypothetical protein
MRGIVNDQRWFSRKSFAAAPLKISPTPGDHLEPNPRCVVCFGLRGKRARVQRMSTIMDR